MTDRGVAVVTGASSGIGAATARRLAADGFQVVAAARRLDRLEQLAAEHPAIRPVALDVTDQSSVDALATDLPDVALLVNNAGGAIGTEPVERANPVDWQWMYDVNVLGVVRVTQALLPALEAGRGGHIIVMSSTAGRVVYEGGAGYTTAKHGATVIAETLRLELNGRPVRVSEIAPGMVRTEEFALNRMRGDAQAATAPYAGVAQPLVAEDIADCVAWVATRPPHVDIDLLVVKPLAQAAAHKVHRVDPDRG